jgi:hypothetical protein
VIVLVAGVAALGLLPRPATACIGPALSIPDLVAESDVVAVGTISWVADAGPASLMASDPSR